MVGDAPGVKAIVVAHDCYNPGYDHQPFDPAKPAYAEKHPPVARYERITLLVDENDRRYQSEDIADAAEVLALVDDDPATILFQMLATDGFVTSE